MASIFVPEAFATLSANGGSDGYVTVTSNAAFYPGAEVFLNNSDNLGQRAVITDLSGTTKIGIRFLAEYPNRVCYYGKNDCSAFTTAKTSTISMPGQVVRVEQPTFSKVAAY